MIESFENRLRKLLKSYAKEDYNLKLKGLKKVVRKLIIQKMLLHILTNTEKNFSLQEIKIKIEEIKKKKKITKTELDKFIKLSTKVQTELEFLLKSEIKEIISLINSWDRINDTFDQKNVKKIEFEDFKFQLQDYIESFINSEEEIPNLTEMIKVALNDVDVKKSNLNSAILKYWENFSEKDSIEEIVNGKAIIVKNLKPTVYEDLYKSTLKDKLIIKLK